MRKRRKPIFEGGKEAVLESTPEILTLRCVKQAPNPRWVICDMNGQQVKVAISPRYTNKLIGKPIKVATVSRGLTEEYQHVP